jgi:hypothetical protein
MAPLREARLRAWRQDESLELVDRLTLMPHVLVRSTLRNRNGAVAAQLLQFAERWTTMSRDN